MNLYAEGILWYLILLDAIIFNVLCWTKGKLHQKVAHWASDYFPLNKFFAIVYLILVLWVGLALLRLQIILFM